MTASAYQKLKRRFLADTNGNFAIMTAILLPLLLGFAGAGIELANVMQVKADLQNTADSAALAAATEARLKEGKLTDEQIKEIARAFVAGQLNGQLTEEQRKEIEKNSPISLTTTSDARGKVFDIKTTINRKIKLNPLLAFIGAKTLDISVTGSARSSVNKGSPLSMYLVLDRSGSMGENTNTLDPKNTSCGRRLCYVTKIASLKTAVSFLIDVLNKADATHTETGSTLVRTAAISYNSQADKETPLAWGTNAIEAYVARLEDFGGTNAVDAMTKAYADLKKANPSEAKTHKAQKNESFERYIVLMTDGEMSSTSIDNSVRNLCKAAKNDGIKIFSVAFMAPSRGRSLLRDCASSPDSYFEPESMEQIVVAFGEIARKAAGGIATLTN